ncbi:leucine-rich repeat-containing protein 46 isoform X1 [Pantherophis guttatus]|uniref:Leucine-rich repeat-containing protein 46 isoform X1 n=2 Tax=Pantherophis guttatus TaxID=94885 RepID=A0A6P9BUB6_PANGU|nr:leucine-rich repeat-containing protein 46 isoform X1 [Pantherophis guttatus]XP_034271486.1 leucine-rich repeat-containing protein 46 isoform X1 [Pantherophis guttatus]XP_034271487.1 leucine-rich repeat-containing protein 46 isoform X1 [Pantherophis guttatus]
MPGANLQPSTEGVCLTKSLIVQRNMPLPVKKEDPEKISEALTSVQVLRLDRERISCIANLPELKHVHSIYLQQNQIKKIENLNCFPNLKFLSLSGNYINKVENLQPLLKLKFLDLSQNCIDTLDIDELPLNLAILDLTGNKCMNQKGYRDCVLAALPHLIELDHKGIPKQKDILQNNEEEENSSEESDYEDCPELFQPLSTEKDFFVDLHNEFSSRSAQRKETAVREHKDRLEELRQRQNLRQLVFNTSEDRTEPLSLPESRSPVLNDLPQTANHMVLNPPQRTANPAVDAGLNIPKEKNEGTTQTQQKISKGKISSAAKAANKNIRK